MREREWESERVRESVRVFECVSVCMYVCVFSFPLFPFFSFLSFSFVIFSFFSYPYYLDSPAWFKDGLKIHFSLPAKSTKLNVLFFRAVSPVKISGSSICVNNWTIVWLLDDSWFMSVARMARFLSPWGVSIWWGGVKIKFRKLGNSRYWVDLNQCKRNKNRKLIAFRWVKSEYDR